MGIRLVALDSINKSIRFIKDSICDDIVMCELGNQYIRNAHRTISLSDPNPDPKLMSRLLEEKEISSKIYFESMGIDHTYIDLNGLDGSITVDLNFDIPEDMVGRFNIVTNIGTSEHVEDQEMVFKNMHDMTSVGGMMIHCIPLINNWPNHGLYTYEEKFIDRLAVINGYDVFNMSVRDYTGKRSEENVIIASLRKRHDKEFVFTNEGINVE